LDVAGYVVRLPLGFAGGLFDADTGLTRFVWRDYDADTGRFTALDPLGEKGGDNDWYGYCLDDPINRADVWGLEDGWIQQPVSPQHEECMSNANKKRQQCDRLFDFLGFAMKSPLRGSGVDYFGKKLCKSVEEEQERMCELQFGKGREGDAGIITLDRQD